MGERLQKVIHPPSALSGFAEHQAVPEKDDCGGGQAGDPLESGRVLIVEDDRPTRLLLERIIRARGHEVVGCESAEAAIDELARADFPLMTLDVHLPGLSGLDLCRRLRSQPNGGTYYILAGTGNSRPEDLREILEAGANDYIGKPYNPGLLNIRLTVAEAAMREIRRRQALEAELFFLAHHDPLTRLSNRTAFEPALARAAIAARTGHPSSVLYIDLDNFKVINDTLGHDTGDSLLIQIARALESVTRPNDALLRIGGDEFVLVLPGSSTSAAVEIADSILAKLEKIVYVTKSQTLRAGGSIGVAEVRRNATPSEIMAEADAACYAAKARGRHRVEVHTPNSGELARRISDIDWAGRIRDAMRDGSLQLWFQPVVSTAGRAIAFQEILMRYVDPSHPEPIAPSIFLPAVQRSGQTTKLDRFVIANALQALASNPSLRVSINISGGLFGEESYCEFVESTLTHSGIDPTRVLFEITENELIANLQKASGAIIRLQRLGCRFGLDDFGSGFSSLTYLKNLPIDFIKIDGAFVHDLPRHSFNQAVLRAIVTIANDLGVETIGEFVETEEDFQLLREIGITCAQGYHIGPASPQPYEADELFAVR